MDFTIKPQQVYADLKTGIILINYGFVLFQMPKIKIKRIAFKIPVNGIGGKNTVIKYAVIPIYINNRNSFGENITIIIHAEMRFINLFKANILFKTDIIIPEKVNLLFFRKEMYIKFCNITVIINIKSRTIYLFQAAKVRSNIIISAYT